MAGCDSHAVEHKSFCAASGFNTVKPPTADCEHWVSKGNQDRNPKLERIRQVASSSLEPSRGVGGRLLFLKPIGFDH